MLLLYIQQSIFKFIFKVFMKTELQLKPFLISILYAITAALVVNTILFILGQNMGFISTTLIIPNAGTPLILPMILMSSSMPVVVGSLIYFLLHKFTNSPKKIFNVVSIGFLIFSFYGPFTIPEVPFSMAIMLNIMHVVVGCSTIFFLGSFKK